jgi:hypothetical protein
MRGGRQIALTESYYYLEFNYFRLDYYCNNCVANRRSIFILDKMIPHKCPVCDGTGKVSRPPWIAGDVNEYPASSSCGHYPCKACQGKGIIWESNPNEKWIITPGGKVK